MSLLVHKAENEDLTLEDHELLPTEPYAQQVTQIREYMGIDERYLKSEVRESDLIAKSISFGAIGALTVVTWFTVLTNDPASAGWFAFHPLLQTLALSLFTYGIITLQPTSQPRTKAAGLVRHQVAIFLLGFPSIALGTFAVWHNKNLKQAPHFTTWHGVMGLLCVVWILAQIALGSGSVWFNGIAFGGGTKAKAVWKYHRLSGYVLFPLLFFTAHLGGGWSHWGELNSVWEIRFLAYTFCPFLIVGGVYWRVRLFKMQFF